MAKYIKEVTRERIIEAALDAFNKLDFHEATVRDIAQKSGISAGSMYKYFDSKDELAKAICTEKVRQILIGLGEHFIGVQGTLNKLRKMTWYYLSFYERNPGVAWVLHISTSIRSWYESPEGWAKIRETGQLVKDILREGQEHGEVRRDIDLRLATRIYFGAMNYMVEVWLAHDRSYPVTAWADAFTDFFFSAVRTHSEQDVPLKCPYGEAVKHLWMQSTKSENHKEKPAEDIA